MVDARFEDGVENALHLKALDAADLQVMSALVQDAVFAASEMRWLPRARRFALLINRFRWEDPVASGTKSRPFERVQSLFYIDNVISVHSQGIDRQSTDMVLSLLAATFEAGEDGAGRVILTLAGDGAIALQVEALDVSLKDVTRPYVAPSRKKPQHPDQ